MLRHCQTISDYLRVTYPSSLLLPRHEFLIKDTLHPSVLLQNNPRGNRNYFLLLCIQPIYSNKTLRKFKGKQLISKLIYRDAAVNPVADK